MAAPVFEGLSSGTVAVGNESTAHVVTLPTSVASGDLLVLYISCSLDFDTLSVSGWTRLDQSVINGGISAGAFFSVYYKTAGASESDPTISLGSSGLVSWVCHRYSNAQMGTVSSWSDTIGSTSDNPDPPQPSTPTTSDDFYVAACCFWADNVTVSTYPSGYGSTASQANTLDGVAVAIKLVSTIENPGAYLLSGSTEHSAFALTVLGLTTSSGSGVVSATGDLVGDGYMDPNGSGAVGGTPDITGDGTTDRSGSGNVSAAGDLVGDGSSTTGGSGTISATGDIAGDGSSGVGGYGSISSTGSLSGSGASSHSGAGDISATGSLSGSGLAPGGSGGTGYGVISSSGSLSSVGESSHYGYGSVSAVASLSGAGLVTSSNGIGAKHMKCCCPGLPDCNLAEDTFTRADSDDPGEYWSEESGDWDIESNVLVCNSAGILATTVCHPVTAPLGSFTARFRLANIADGRVYRFRAGNPMTSPLEGTCTIADDPLNPGWFIMDAQITDGTNTASWTPFPITDLDVNDVVIDFCYYPGAQLTLQVTVGGNPLEYELGLCIGSTGSSNCHSGLGNFAFLEGDFDDWVYKVHWAENHECPYCECLCRDGSDVVCWPDEFTLTVVNPLDCPNIPDTYTLYRQDEPGGDGTDPFAEPVLGPSPSKRVWISDEVQIPDSSGGLYDDEFFRWKLSCDQADLQTPYPTMQLQMIFYVKGSDVNSLDEDYLGFDDTYPETTDRVVIPTNSRTHAVNLSSATCDPIMLNFPPIIDRKIVCGSSFMLCYPGAYVVDDDPDCTEYTYVFSVIITE